MADATTQRNFKPTLNLPRTAFAMKANLVQNEPASAKRWAEMGLYDRLRQQADEAKAAGNPKPPYVFHDGPPYANGDIHLGHLLNKCLKDFVVRSRAMLGYDCPFTPGWDCHGLPIEHKVMQEMQAAGAAGDGAGAATEPGSGADLDAVKVRRKCKAYAEKFVKTQSKQMQRLLTLADYADPYLTMAPKYEAAVLEVFASLVERGLVYRDLKPVHWSISNRTALAEAELEYHQREDTSVYVRFPVVNSPVDLPEHTSLMIWTTTPWTLPANQAVAVSTRAEYGVYETPGGPVIVACDLAAKVLPLGGAEAGKPRLTCRGDQLVSSTYRHPFLDREGRVVAADYVTLEDGTGLVHTAPGHGTEDYQTGLREGLDIYCPVREDGTFDDTAPDWLAGKSVWEGNALVCDRLDDCGHLFNREDFTHSYPHDWRSKQPTIFRATEQWFIGVDRGMGAGSEARGATNDASASPLQRAGDTPPSLRARGLRAAESEIDFIPAWGRNRLRGMLESRPDWCVSRQRSWGLPIPAFFPPENEPGVPLLTAASVRAVASYFAQHKDGSDAWFFAEPDELLRDYDPEADPEVSDDGPLAWILEKNRRPQHPIRKGGDTFDVWFESGSSWHAVLRTGWRDKQATHTGEAASGDAVADLYLEGSDQHRGWFQHSLLPALAVTGKPAFKTVLTHGFMVDRDGKKMSKSGGNALSVDDLMKDFGADVCRWWVASLNPDNDIKVDPEFFKLAGEQYRKVRNTLRFMLSNLGDFDPATLDAVELGELDRWALHELASVTREVRDAYEGHAFRRACERLFAFCNETLSSVYLFAAKDRLYCDAADSPRRRSSQAAMWRITDALCRLLAPLMPHTTDEAFGALRGKEACVHLEVIEPVDAPPPSDAMSAFLARRDALLKAMEDYRQARGIDNPLDLGVLTDVEAWIRRDAADLLGVSWCEPATDGAWEVRDLRDQPRCERSWRRDGTVKPRDLPGTDFDKAMLSDRDFEAVRSALT